MKRLFAWATLLALFVPCLVSADVRQVRTNLVWRTSTSPTTFGATVDSSAFSNGATTQHADTTAPFSTEKWVLPPATHVVTLNDSMIYARIEIIPSSTTSVSPGEDSLYITLQVSLNGSDFVDATPTRVFVDGLDTGGQAGLAVIEQGSSHCFSASVRQQTGGVLGGLFLPIISTAAAPTWVQCFGYPVWRLIVQGDQTGSYQGSIVHLETVAPIAQ